MATPTTQNDLAIYFRALHQPGNPLILTNIHDVATASYIATHPKTKAIATASYAIANSQGISDDSLTLSHNLATVRTIANVLRREESSGVSPQLLRLPLTVDIQDGYEDVAQTIRELIKLGAVGCNIEDLDSATGKLRPLSDAIERIKLALQTARELGVPDFVINARTDVLSTQTKGTIEGAIERGKAFLEAGACTVFVWGGAGGRGVSREEIVRLVAAFGGRLNVKLILKDGFLTVPELKELGVARVSLGPELWRAAMGAFREKAEMLLESCV